MLAAVNWDDLSLSGAFLLGALFATFACLRIVRAVATLFDQGPKTRPPWRRHRDEPDTDD